MVLAAAVVTGCSSVPAAAPTSSPPTSQVAPATTVPPTTVPPTTTTDPGLLPQTSVEPPVGAALEASLSPLWSAIVQGSEDEALAIFFPRTAYLQMKTGVLADPASDYADRLLGFYHLDLAAYHAALGPQTPPVTLISVNADPAYASWIPPGSCENKIGYWHLPGVRLVYRQSGALQSFAVASLISWRGVWYVVHLGPNPRPSDQGTVDQPASGPGTPGPSGGC
jgi:hypothetical protein